MFGGEWIKFSVVASGGRRSAMEPPHSASDGAARRRVRQIGTGRQGARYAGTGAGSALTFANGLNVSAITNAPRPNAQEPI
jgi:hypothetical protein